MAEEITSSWHKQVEQSNGTKIRIYIDGIDIRDFTGYSIHLTLEAFDLMKAIIDKEV